MNIHKISLPLSNFLNKIFNILIKNRIFRFIFFSLNKSINNFKIKNDDTSLYFFCPNYLIKYRIDTLLTKEPETISWINTFNKDDIFYDVGSNIGLYSCFAANQGIKTYAFEPSVFNTEIIVKNINLNNLQSLVTLIPLSLHNKNLISSFKISDAEKGAAFSTFAENYTHDGKQIKTIIDYKTPGITLDKCIELFGIPYPNKIKIDVDGTEHLILQGAENVLKKCNSILIEVNEEFFEQYNEVSKILKKNNFKLLSKKNTTESKLYQNTYNQIWNKNLNENQS